MQRTPFPNNLSDHPGRDFTASAPVQTKELRDRQAAKGMRGDTGGVMNPMTWGWNVDER